MGYIWLGSRSCVRVLGKVFLLAKAARVGMKTAMPATYSSTLQHRTGNRRFLLAADLPTSRLIYFFCSDYELSSSLSIVRWQYFLCTNEAMPHGRVGICLSLEHVELPAKLLENFSRSNKSNINQSFPAYTEWPAPCTRGWLRVVAFQPRWTHISNSA